MPMSIKQSLSISLVMLKSSDMVIRARVHL
jgi:hypothetical protein